MRRLIIYGIVVGTVSTLLSLVYYTRLYNCEKKKQSYINKTFDYILHSTDKNDALFVGSSRVWVHVDPDRVKQQTGLSAYNLACDGSSLVEHSAMIETYLQHHPAPKYIFLNVDFLCFDVFHETYNFPEYIPYLGDSTVSKALLPFNPKLRSFVKKNLYLLKWLSAADDADKVSALFNPTFFERDLHPGYKGFAPVHKNWDKEADEKMKLRKKAVFPKEGQQIFTSLVQTCRKHNIQLVAMVAPLYKRYSEVITNARWIMGEINKICASNHVDLWDFSHILEDEKQYYYNSTHLNAAGARIYTDSLTSRINKEVIP